MAQQSTLEFLVAAQVTGQEQIARLINDTDKLNKTTKGLQSAFAQMGGAARSLSEVQKNAAAIDAARAEKIARLSQEFYNNALSIDRTAKSARDSASAFEEAFQAQEMAAQAQRDAAAAADALRAKLDPMIPIQNRFNAEMDRASDLLRMGAISQKEYAQATTMARQNLYSAQQALVGMEKAQSGVIVNGIRYNSMADYQSRVLRNQRQGVQQLGMQFNDLATSVATGANPITAFNQQIGQVGIAMAQMEGKMGAVGQFLIGPWGTALTIATMALGFLAEKFLFTDDSAKKAKSSITSLAQQMDFAKMSAEDLESVNRLLAESNADVARTAYQAANATAAKASQDAAAAHNAIELAKAELKKRRAILESMQEPTAFAGGGVPGAALTAGQIATNRQNSSIQSQIDHITNLEKSYEGLQVRTRKYTAEAYALKSGMDAGARATERMNVQLNIIQNAYASGSIKTFQEYQSAILAARETHQKAIDAIEASERSSKKNGRSRGLTDAQKEAKKIAESTKRWQATMDGQYVKEYQDYRNMLINSTEFSNNRIAELEEGFAQDNINRFSEMSKGIAVISEMNAAYLAEQIDKPYQELQNSFQAIGASVSDAFKGMITGATSWKDAMRGIINSVIDQLWQLYVVQQIVGFVTKAIGGITGNAPVPEIQAVPSFMKAANGTINSPGGLTWVGERGPELLNLPKGSQVIPAHRAQNMDAGSGVTVNVDARGSADPAAVRAQVEAGILQAAPAIIAAAQQRTVTGLRRPKLGGVMQ